MNGEERREKRAKLGGEDGEKRGICLGKDKNKKKWRPRGGIEDRWKKGRGGNGLREITQCGEERRVGAVGEEAEEEEGEVGLMLKGTDSCKGLTTVVTNGDTEKKQELLIIVRDVRL